MDLSQISAIDLVAARYWEWVKPILLRSDGRKKDRLDREI